MTLTVPFYMFSVRKLDWSIADTVGYEERKVPLFRFDTLSLADSLLYKKKRRPLVWFSVGCWSGGALLSGFRVFFVFCSGMLLYMLLHMFWRWMSWMRHFFLGWTLFCNSFLREKRINIGYLDIFTYNLVLFFCL